jgi:hypothetical protein
MKRRLFLLSGSASAVSLTLTACGGGGGGGSSAPAAGAATPTAATAGTTPTATIARAAVAYPFGARLDAYAAGTKPSIGSAAMDSFLAGAYDAWKARALVDVPTVPGGKAIKFGNSGQWLVVSEGIGYGMLITVLMAGHDAAARDAFDGLLTTARARPAYSLPAASGGAYLMDWRLNIDGSSSDAAGGGWNAMDGDLDIAMALLMADRQWGSTTGRWNYKQEAINTINALKTFNMRDDGATKGLPNAVNNRTSDYMTGHFRAFERATGDAFWGRAVTRACELLETIQANYSPNCGLMPDFIVNTDTNPAPSPGFIGDGVDTEGFYYANAQRNPWRLGTDVVTSGDGRVKAILQKLVSFVQSDCGGNASQIAVGYHLDGSNMGKPYAPKGMIGPMLCGAMIDGNFQGFLDNLWSWTSGNFTTDYYDSELMLIPMLVASGNWWTA